MSKVIKWQYSDFFQSRREKLVNILLSEIIFLKSHHRKSESNFEKIYLKKTLDKLEYLLNVLKTEDTDLSDKEFDKILKLIYSIFTEVVENINYILFISNN